MRKRSTKEIIEATVTGSFNRQKRINQEKRRKALEKVAQQRSADQNKKPDLATAKIRDLEARTEVSKARRDALVAKTEKLVTYRYISPRYSLIDFTLGS